MRGSRHTGAEFRAATVALGSAGTSDVLHDLRRGRSSGGMVALARTVREWRRAGKSLDLIKSAYLPAIIAEIDRAYDDDSRGAA